MIDEVNAILSAAILLLAGGMWPIGFMFGMCSECCGSCGWFALFDRCLHYEILGSNPPAGGDCRFVARLDVDHRGQESITSGGTFGESGLRIARVQSKISHAVRIFIPGGASRTPVGQTRTQVFRFLRPNPLAGVSYDFIGPPWHLEVEISVLGVEDDSDETVESLWGTDEYGQPRLTLTIQQGSLAVTRIEPVTLFPTGLQRWSYDDFGYYRFQDSSFAATRVGDDNFSWSVQRSGEAEVLEHGFAVSGDAICGKTSGVTRGVFLGEQAVSEFLSGSGSLDFGNRRVTALPANIACGMSRDAVGHGIAMGAYPEKVYFNSSTPLADAICGDAAVFSQEMFPNTEQVGLITQAECMRRWSLGARNVKASDFWAGDTLLWNLQNGPYRQEFDTNGGTFSLTTTKRIAKDDFGGPGVCRQGFTYFTIAPDYGEACVPSSITVIYDFTIDYYRINNDGISFGDAYPVRFSGEIALTPIEWTGPPVPGIGDLGTGRIAYYGGFIVQPELANSTPITVSVFAFPELVLPCDVPSPAEIEATVFTPSAFSIPPLPENLNIQQTWSPRGEQGTGTIQDEMYYALSLVGTCGPWSPVSADGGETTRTCFYSDTEVIEGEFTQTATVARSMSALPKAITKTGGDQGFFRGLVTQLGRCELTGLRWVTAYVSPNNTFQLIGNPHILNIAEAGVCYSFEPIFTGERRGDFIDGDVSCTGDATAAGIRPCEECVPSVEIESDGENASVRYNEAGERAGVIDVIPKRTWRGGEGVTFRVACGQDEFTQTVKRVDTVPSSPTNLTVTRGPCGEAFLTWEAPHDGGQPITQYTVYFRRIGSFSASSVSTAALSATVTGLLRLGYEFFATATNSVGQGLFSDIATNGFALAAPTGLTAAPRDPCDRVSLSWTAPPQNECIVVAAYQVQIFAPSSGWQTFATIAGTETAATVTGLAPGQQYSFRVGRVDDANTVLFSNIIQVPSCPAE